MRGYATGEHRDEAFAGPDDVRPSYAEVLARLDGLDLDDLAARVAARLEADDVRFGDEGFRVDPVPRLLTAEEWSHVERGVTQRMLALEALVADAYAGQRLVAEGVVPRGVLEQTPYLERDLVGATAPPGGWLSVAGFDLVRDADGRFRVLEDNLRTPSGVAYAQSAVDAVRQGVPALGLPAQDLVGQAARALRRCLEASAPDVEGELVLLTDGSASSAWTEHRTLAEAGGLHLATPAELCRAGGEVCLRDGRRVRAVYRRTDEDRVHGDDGRLTDVADLLLEPTLAGSVGLVNHFGTGVGDDKGVYRVVDEVVRHVLGEEPVLPSVGTYDVTDPGRRHEAVPALDRLVTKPRDGQGGQGVVVGPAASEEEVESARHAVEDDPQEWVVQDTVSLSTCPVVVDGHLEPRHVDLRVFAYRAGSDVVVLRGGLTRVAFDRGSMVVNSSRGGGAKGTWVV
jgi:uncharacterized circularly permuted ATP-grasp superfamily protein